jgi:hypothetical protein
MHEIPQPEVLDPDRMLLADRDDLTADDHASRAALLGQALHESCAYARQLWQSLDAVRGYLLDSLPPDPHAAGRSGRRSAAPTGPDDDEGWESWITAYAAVTSVLTGPHGDSGFGSEEARREARDRRLVLTEQPTAGPEGHPDGAGEPMADTARVPARPQAEPVAAGRSPLRLAARLAVLLLAVRGLRRGRR